LTSTRDKRLGWHSPTVLSCSVASYRGGQRLDEQQPLVKVNSKARQSVSGKSYMGFLISSHFRILVINTRY